MAQKFDLAVVGTGSAASTVALALSRAGSRVAVVDSKPYGGTCVLRGCEPKKVLLEAADAVDRVRRMKGKGVVAAALRIDWSELMRSKRSFTDPVPRQREARFTEAGIATYHGRARFVSRTSLEIGTETVEADRFVIAAGAKPARLMFPGEEFLKTSEDFLELDSLPDRIVFVGGGYISFEFAHLAVRAGARATILHRGSRPLAGFDPDLVGMLVKRSRDLGVEIETETAVEGIERSGGGFTVRASGRVFPADLVVHGAGRVPNIEDLGLSEAGVKWGEKRGVEVNQYLQSVSNPAVYAAGDAVRNGGLPLTPVAGYDGEIVVENLLHGNRRSPDYRGIPTVAFTIPPIASVGLHETAAREQGLHFRKNFADSSDWYSSRRVAEPCSGYKVLVEEDSGIILGAHLLGPRADELINVFALAIRLHLPASSLEEVTFAFPTHGSDVPSML